LWTGARAVDNGFIVIHGKPRREALYTNPQAQQRFPSRGIPDLFVVPMSLLFTVASRTRPTVINARVPRDARARFAVMVDAKAVGPIACRPL
jgi:hypothetical protein